MDRRLVLPLATLLLLSRGVRPYSDKTVEIVELVVPESPKVGDDVTLTCRFNLVGNNHRLYTVNWWRGKDQFYTYKGTTMDRKHAYSFQGIQVKEEASTEESVVLQDVSEDTSGLYKCEVMGEGPSFRTAVANKTMTVVIPPRKVEILAQSQPDPPVYHVGETIHLNCTAMAAKPRATLTWKIDDVPVEGHHVLRLPDYEDQRGRITSTLNLAWDPPAYFRSNVAKVVCHAVVGGHTTIATKDIYLDPASSASLNHLYASKGCQLSTTWTILSLVFFLVRHSP
ncbi:cell adhesion molecule 1-like [Portunus trituberculatus]|uniref:cell adhesion molecule 1-like n=1 Tax=Portunus trituberculatus TaxID=210409 RepID=UPI001E1CF0C2|nr:cell adhesion molecule 1-like [Portunus trituberculatus]